MSMIERENAELKQQLESLMFDCKPMTDENMAESGWVRLPKDADGEVIRVGDELGGYGHTIEVVEIRYGRSGWVLISRDGNAYADTFAFVHTKPDTWERIIYEAMQAGRTDETVDVTSLITRCKVLAGGES